jgi:nicotinate phosphoribosyltransferase
MTKVKPVITSLCDLDLYFINMAAAWFQNYPNGTAAFRFKDRKNQLPKTQEFVDKINEQLDMLCDLRFTEYELEYLFGLKYLRGMLGFKEFLRGFKFRRDLIHCKLIGGEIEIWTEEASVLITQFFEVPVLAIVNELYSIEQYKDYPDKEGLITNNVEGIIRTYKDIKMPFMEFGTRRRFSAEFQNRIVSKLKDNPKFLGTSNVKLAMIYGLKAYGTMAHSWIMYHQALDEVPVAMSQKKAFEVWQKTFKGDNGYILSDTLGTQKFIEDITLLDARTFSGPRHDSDCPFLWTSQMIDMYIRHGENPLNKTVIYSDGMFCKLANDLYDSYHTRIKQMAGIGTAITNPVCPTSSVMKMCTANGGKPVAKLSNDPAKTQCRNPHYIEYLKRAIEGRYI